MIKFGTDGIRGRAGAFPCTVDTALRIGRAAVQICERPTPVVMVARDTRASGATFEAALLAAISQAGGEAISAGILPTAGLMANIAAGEAEIGIMITASHNPHPDNGFKLIGPNGKKLTAEMADRVELLIAEGQHLEQIGSVTQASLAARSLYFEALQSVAPEPKELYGLKIAVDLSNGAASSCIRWLEERYAGTEWVWLGRGDGLINHGVGSEHPEHLAAAIVEHDCMGGFAVDGDADRCVVVDECGDVVAGDALTWLLAREMSLEALAVTIMSNVGLERSLPGIRIVRTPVGDKHLSRVMDEEGIALGAEESGHVLFLDGLPGGDGLLTGLRSMAIAARSEQGLSGSFSGYLPMPRMKGKVGINQRVPLTELPEVQTFLASAEQRLGGGRVLLRYSGTEPVLRILVEGSDVAVTRSVYSEIEAILERQSL